MIQPVRRWLVLVTATAAVLALVACSEAESEYASLEEYPDRRFAATQWDTVGWIGGAEVDDTTLVRPSSLRVWNGRLSVLERSLSQVRTFDLSGEPLWSFGSRGGGPGEMKLIADISPTPWGSLWILDPENLKVVEVDSAGLLVQERSFGHFPVSPGTFSPTRGGEVIISTQSPEQGYIRATADSLAILAIGRSPWADSVDVRFNIRTVNATDPTSGALIDALFHGPGFSVMWPGAEEPEVYPYLEHVPWALKSGPRVREAGGDTARYGAVAASVVDGEIYFLFGGRPLRQAHPAEPTLLVDVYGLDGAYRHSYLLPFDADGFAAIDADRFALLTLHEEVFPRIYILEPLALGR